MTQTATEQARLTELDAVVSEQSVIDAQTPAELFAVVDALDSQSALKRALSDPATPAEARQAVANRLLEGRVGGQASWIVSQLVARRWNSGSGLADAVERQAVRSVLRQAQEQGQLDEVIGQLTGFLDVVRGDAGLRSALSGTTRSVEDRQQLVRRLLDGKAHGWVVDLATRAVAGRERSPELTVEHYLELAAALRDRDVAHVTVARALTPEQDQRLRAALARIVGREVDVRTVVDESVLGGARVRIGDEIIEGTVSDRLQQLHRQLG